MLVNIVLHGLEEHVDPNTCLHGGNRLHPKVIRYADDFVVISDSREKMASAKKKAQEELKGVDLELKEEKMRITEVESGFDFLGFTTRQFDPTLTRAEFKTILKPSKKTIGKHVRALKYVLRRMTTARQEEVIAEVDPIVI